MARDYEIYPGFYRDARVNATIEEKRAPTDESVRLLKEFGDAARDQIVGVIRNKNNGIDFTAHVFNEVDNPFDTKIRVRCAVNGRSIDFSFLVDRSLPRVELANSIVDRIAKEIARELVIVNFKNLEGVFK